MIQFEDYLHIHLNLVSLSFHAAVYLNFKQRKMWLSARVSAQLVLASSESLMVLAFLLVGP